MRRKNVLSCELLLFFTRFRLFPFPLIVPCVWLPPVWLPHLYALTCTAPSFASSLCLYQSGFHQHTHGNRRDKGNAFTLLGEMYFWCKRQIVGSFYSQMYFRNSAESLPHYLIRLMNRSKKAWVWQSSLLFNTVPASGFELGWMTILKLLTSSVDNNIIVI